VTDNFENEMATNFDTKTPRKLKEIHLNGEHAFNMGLYGEHWRVTEAYGKYRGICDPKYSDNPLALFYRILNSKENLFFEVKKVSM